MSDKINITDPAQVREWEERIARFEGYTSIDRPKLGHTKWRNPEGQYIGTVPPNYSRSLPDLMRVLNTLPEWSIKKHRHPFYPDLIKILVETKGIEGGYLANTLEDAIFGAICLYIGSDIETPEPQAYKAAGEGGIILHDYNDPAKGGILRPFWLSWWHSDKFPDFELQSPWWVSGHRSGRSSICAALMAASEKDAKNRINASYADEVGNIEFRFVNGMPTDWAPFDGRFPREDWMQWEGGS